jgi:hypothetical protein
VSDMAQFGFEVNDLVPNPAIDKAELLFTAAKHESFSIKVFNLLGQEMYSNTIQSMVGDNKVYLDASHWSCGTYIYSLSNGRNTHTGKLQVSR